MGVWPAIMRCHELSSSPSLHLLHHPSLLRLTQVKAEQIGGQADWGTQLGLKQGAGNQAHSQNQPQLPLPDRTCRQTCTARKLAISPNETTVKRLLQLQSAPCCMCMPQQHAARVPDRQRVWGRWSSNIGQHCAAREACHLWLSVHQSQATLLCILKQLQDGCLGPPFTSCLHKLVPLLPQGQAVRMCTGRRCCQFTCRVRRHACHHGHCLQP